MKYKVYCGMRPFSGWPPPITVTTSTIHKTVEVEASSIEEARAEAIDECYRRWGNSIEHVKPLRVEEA